MRIDIAALRQQAWRGEETYRRFLDYARQVGATVVGDEITTNSEREEFELARWWRQNS